MLLAEMKYLALCELGEIETHLHELFNQSLSLKDNSDRIQNDP